jgi:hypothetical protein
MNLISKGLFKVVKTDNDSDVVEPEVETEIKLVDWGWDRAKAHHGGDVGLMVCIKTLYESNKEKIKKNDIGQEKAKKPYRVKLQEYISKNEALQAKVNKIKNETIPNIKSRIDNLLEEIRHIRQNPEEFTGDKAGKASFIIGLIILIFLTIYLFVFYSSASYSAFFKEFTPDKLKIASSIFDPQAFTNALKDGATELLLIATIPFVFLGLGFLIHKFQQSSGFKKIARISSIILVTFIFDFILAFEITSKIYGFKKANSFEDLPDYKLVDAFSDVNFYLIIFAGFIVYLIWGFVFDFVMEAYENQDKINILIKSKKEEIGQAKQEITAHEDNENIIIDEIGQNKTEAEKLRTILDHSDIINPKELENSIAQFMDGWLEWLAANKKADNLRQNAHQIVEEFISINVKSLEIPK